MVAAGRVWLTPLLRAGQHLPVGLPETFLTLAKLYFGLPWRELRNRLESSVLSVSPCTLSGEDTISKNLYCVARSRIG
eukprot:COSAG01_NODE_192_length_22494_cov_100.193384_10_plen_78_part_00